MRPTMGRIVIMRMSGKQAAEINRRRTTGASIAERIAKNNPVAAMWPLGAQAHIGSEVYAGDEFPMVIVKLDAVAILNRVNGQVLLDGNDVYWATSVAEGTEDGTWHWPTHVTSTP
ncbi:MAG: hypothetical protein ACRDQZ_25530 [Mycobacteriales bacterium]